MIRFTVTVAIVAVSLSAIAVESSLAADAKPVAFYDANHAKLAVDPSTQGWIQANDKKHRATVRAVGEDGARAWRIEDNDDDGSEGLYYHSGATRIRRMSATLGANAPALPVV